MCKTAITIHTRYQLTPRKTSTTNHKTTSAISQPKAPKTATQSPKVSLPNQISTYTRNSPFTNKHKTPTATNVTPSKSSFTESTIISPSTSSTHPTYRPEN